jgi:hypothetical protein
MRKRARTVLCGGRSAMIVPTASPETEAAQRLSSPARGSEARCSESGATG